MRVELKPIEDGGNKQPGLLKPQHAGGDGVAAGINGERRGVTEK